MRLKSFDDLHKLWFICLKERNYLLTERLYYRQVAQSQPEPSRMLKVKATMRNIKVVLGERARAAAMLRHDKEVQLKAENEAARLSAVIQDSLRDPVERLLRPMPKPVPKTAGDSSAAPAADTEVARQAAADAVKSRAGGKKGVQVTYKKYGRKYTVPAARAPEKPTAAQRKREARDAAFFARRSAMLKAEPTLAPPSAAYTWATQGKAGTAGSKGAAAPQPTASV